MDETRNRELGRRIAAMRLERGWSQKWLASRADMTQSVLSRVEAGKREARASELAKLAVALGVGPESLLTGLDEPEHGAAPMAPATPHASALDALQRGPSDRAAGRLDALAPSAAYLEMRQDVGDDAGPGAPSERDELAYSAIPSPASALPDAEARPGRDTWLRDRMARLRSSPRRQGREPAVFDRRLPAPADLSGLPKPVVKVLADYLRLRALVADDVQPGRASWDAVDSHGRRRPAGKPSGVVAGRPAAAVNWHEPRDRYARLWRHELGIGVDGPVPDLVALLEDTALAEVVVVRLATDEPVCANLTVGGAGSAGDARRYAAGRGRDSDDVSFIFVNADRPVALQRHALVHAFAHLVLGHGDVVDRRIEWSRATPLETEANDFAEEFLAPADAIARWYGRHGDPQPSVDVLLGLAAAFGITYWAAFYRSRAAGRLSEKPQARLMHELRARQWELLPEQSFRGGLRDTLSTLSDESPLPPPGAVGVGGVPAPLTRETASARTRVAEPVPAVLRVPARLRLWTLQALRGGRLSLEQAAAVLHRPPAGLAAELERIGLE